jgi:hypothetical protein
MPWSGGKHEVGVLNLYGLSLFVGVEYAIFFQSCCSEAIVYNKASDTIKLNEMWSAAGALC